jgi:tetratricopeptide (TPR) repeat protein
MARRVNTNFVIGLGAVLAVGTAGAFVAMRTNILQTRDPKKLVAQGEAAEKVGDLNSAAQYYARAANFAGQAHAPDAAELWERAGNTALALSVKEKNTDESQRDYQTARQWWNNALLQDPKYLPVLERTLEDSHEAALFFRGAQFWTALEENADKFLAAKPDNARAYTYRGEARLESIASLTVGAMQEAKIAQAQDDVDKALQLDPEFEPAVALAGRIGFQRSLMARGRGNNDEATKLRQESTKRLKEFLEKHPASPQVATTLAVGAQLDGDRSGAIAILEAAAGKNPGDARVAGMLSTLYAAQEPARAEATLKALVESSNEKADAYARLAQFYEQQSRTDDAIATWKSLLANPLTGGGLSAFKEAQFEASALCAISWDYMDIAEKQGITTPNGKTALAESVTYADKLRTSKQASGVQDMLDGRMQLLRRNIPQAINLLLRAEAAFATPDQGNWFKTKMLLSTAYNQQSDWGVALRKVDDVVQQFPNAPGPRLRKAEILIHSARYNEALGEVEPMTKPQVPEVIRKYALALQAEAYNHLGNSQGALTALTTIDTPEAMLQSARDRIDQGDMQGALEQIDKVLEKNPENLSALYLGVVASIQAEQKEKGKEYIARGLKLAPDNTQFKLLEAAINESGGNLAAAQEKVLQAIADPIARNLSLAQLYGRENNLQKQFEATQAAAKAVEDAGTDAPSGAMNQVIDQLFVLSMQLARSSSNKADQDKYWALAEKYVQQAESRDLDGVKGQLYRGRLQLAKGGELAAAAVQTLEQAVAARQDFSMGHTFLGEAYANQTPPRNDAAIEQFRTAIQQKPDNLAALCAAIVLLVEKQDRASLDEATTYYRQGLQFFPRDKRLAAMGDTLGDPADAIRNREKLRETDPGNTENIKRLALLYSRQGDPQKAIDVLRPVYDKSPDLASADFLAKMYRDTQQPGEALRMYTSFTTSNDNAVKFQGLLLLGEMYRSMNKPDDVVTVFQQAMAIEPKGVDEAERRLADFYFESGQMAKAEGLYVHIHDLAKGADPRVTYRFAETLIREGKFADADKILNGDILTKNPQDAKALVLRAVGMLSQNHPSDALGVLNDVLSRDPKNTDALFYRASTLLAMNKDLEEAARDLLAVRDSKSGTGVTPEAQLNSRLLVARVYRQSRRYSEAAGAYEDAIKSFGNLPSIRVDYAQYLLWLLGVEQKLAPTDNSTTAFNVRSVKADDRLRALLANSEQVVPNASIWQVLEGRRSAVLGDVAGAHAKLAAAFKAASDDPVTASAYLQALIDDKAYEEAAATASRLLGNRPDYVEYYAQRATAYAGLGKTGEARDDFNRALDLVVNDNEVFMSITDRASKSLTPEVVIEMMRSRVNGHPEQAVARMALAAQLIVANRGGEAVGLLAGLIADPAAGNLRSQAQRALGLAKYQAKDFTGARQAYDEILRANPNDAETLNNLAYMLSEDMNDPAAALPYAQRAVAALREGNPEGLLLSQGSVLDTYGWVKFRSGDKEGAIADLRRAIEMEPLPMAYFHLARVYKDIGRVNEARQAVSDGLRVASASKDPVASQLEGLRRELGS